MPSRPDDPGPYYDSHVFVCTNERPPGHPRGCCKDKGSVHLRDYMKARAKELGLKRVRINTAGCLERCELGPSMVIYPEQVWYGHVTVADVPAIVDAIASGTVVERLRIPDEKLTGKAKPAATPDSATGRAP